MEKFTCNESDLTTNDWLSQNMLSFLRSHPVNTTNFASMMYSLDTDYNTEGGILIVTRRTIYNRIWLEDKYIDWPFVPLGLDEEEN